MANAGTPIRSVRWAGAAGKTAVVEVNGDIDLQRSKDFQRGLTALFEGAPKGIVLDLSGVPYMDSSGVASLVKLLSRVRRERISLRLAGLTARVRSVFETTRLDAVFDIFPTPQEALEA